MSLRTPPLHLLRIFEAAAGHQSFKLAAEELHLTPSAVSHQVKALEQQLGFLLFHRLNRKIELSAGGQAYFTVVASSFSRLYKGTSDVLNRFTQKRLKISMMPSMARHLVVPGLPGLRAQLPEVELVIEAESGLVEFHQSDVDVAVRYGRGPWPDMHCEKISDIHASPVCSPGFARLHGLRRLQDLSTAPLINFSFMTDTWLRFAEAAGTGPLRVDSGLTFNNYDIAIQAAEQGLGIAIGLLEFERKQLADNRLIQPFALQFKMKEGLWLVYRPEDKERPEIIRFVDWFKAGFSHKQLQQEAAPHP